MSEMSPADAFNAALENHDAGRFAEAQALYRQVVEKNPDDAEARYLLGVVTGQLGQYEEAARLVAEAIASIPPDAEAFNNLGEFNRRAGRFPEAIAAFRQALAMNPNSAEASCNIGLAFLASGEHADAEASIRRALAINPKITDAHAALAAICRQQGNIRGAIHEFRQSLSLNPDQPETHVQLAMALLASGEFAEGWVEHEWRFKCKGYLRDTNDVVNQWDGSPLNGRTILLRAEQGLGDTIQFVRYAPLVAGRGGRVILQTWPALAGIFKSVEGTAQVVPFGEPVPSFDVACALMSLPKIFGTMPDTIPATVPYVFADPGLIERWRTVLEHVPGMKVGIAWQGNPKNPLDAARSAPLAVFEALARVPGLSLISLQKGPGQGQAGQAGFPVIDLGDKLDGAVPFSDTPAVMKNLDLVVSVDTVTAHLAGALGVKVWTVLPFVSDWRWMVDREDSPWYPTMHLFRQGTPGDWAGAVGRMVERIKSAAL